MAQVHVTFRGETLTVDADSWQAAADQLIERHGRPTSLDYPMVTPVAAPAVEDTAPPSPPPAPRGVLVQPPTSTPAPQRPQGWHADESHVSATAKARSEADAAAAVAAGFSVKRPLFARGTLLMVVGVENARNARVEFGVMPSTPEACADVVNAVKAEERRDMPVVIGALRMTSRGNLAVGDQRLTLTEDALGGVANRAGLPAAGRYLRGCWPELRAINVNHWCKALQDQETAALQEFGAQVEQLRRDGKHKAAAEAKPPTPAKMVLRTRNAPRGGREVFAAVSESYAAFDCDKVAQAIALAMPEGSKARVHYDGTKMRADVLFMSTAAPEDWAAGEFFRAGVRIITDDTGGGGVVVSSFIEQNLCLNLLIIDKAAKPVANLRHLGSVERLAKDFKQALVKAQDNLGHFLKQWGYARKDDLIEQAVQDDASLQGLSRLPVSLQIEGLFRGTLERELVQVRGRVEDNVQALVRSWNDDTSSDGPRAGTLTRAGLVNAFTRYAHESADPFEGAAIEQQAAALLWPGRGGRKPVIPCITND